MALLFVQPVAAEAPVSVAIPRIGLEAPVVPVGLEEDGAMAAPTDPDTVGWYAFGPEVGLPGNAILAGHVDWGGQLRVFGLLNVLEVGDMVQILDASGVWRSYSVQWAELFEVDTAPVAEIFAQDVDEVVTLITCGGLFDHEREEYLGRLVVRAVRSPELEYQVDVVSELTPS